MSEQEVMDYLVGKKSESDEQGCPVVAGIVDESGEIIYATNSIEDGFAKKFPEEIKKRSEFFYRHVKHAEIVLVEKLKLMGKDLQGKVVLVTLLPCRECLKVLLAEGVKEIVYREDHEARGWSKRSHDFMIEYSICNRRLSE
ncbi:deaminase [Microgenomates group bacterium]|nr:deaminase [Microgenomates group bacterium]